MSYTRDQVAYELWQDEKAARDAEFQQQRELGEFAEARRAEWEADLATREATAFTFAMSLYEARTSLPVAEKLLDGLLKKDATRTRNKLLDSAIDNFQAAIDCLPEGSDA